MEACAVLEDLAAADDGYEMFMATSAATVVKAGCRCRGTCSTPATLTFADRAGNTISTDSTVTCSSGTGATTFVNVSTGDGDRVLVSGEGFLFSVSNNPDPETDTYTICVEYTRN
jgi:hypothetical protein